MRRGARKKLFGPVTGRGMSTRQPGSRRGGGGHAAQPLQRSVTECRGDDGPLKRSRRGYGLAVSEAGSTVVCEVTGARLPLEDTVELFGHRVGAAGKAVLLERWWVTGERPTREVVVSSSLRATRLAVGSFKVVLVPVLLLAVAVLLGVVAESFGLAKTTVTPWILPVTGLLAVPLLLVLRPFCKKTNGFPDAGCVIQLNGEMPRPWQDVLRCFIQSLPIWGAWVAVELTPGVPVLTAAAIVGGLLLLQVLPMVLGAGDRSLADLLAGTRVTRDDA